MPIILPHRSRSPKIADDCYVAPNVSLIGDIEVGSQSSLWFGAVLRGDVQPIRIGARTSIQDNCVVHATRGWAPTIVGDECTVGHGAILHGCTLGRRVLVGMNAVILDGAEVGDETLVGAGAIVTTESKLPGGVLVLGAPAKVIRPLSEKERAFLKQASENYVGDTAEYRAIVPIQLTP